MKNRKQSSRESPHSSKPHVESETLPEAEQAVSASIQRAVLNGSSLTASQVLDLQKTVGNQATRQLIQSRPGVQRMPEAVHNRVQREDEDHTPIETAPNAAPATEGTLEEGEGTVQRTPLSAPLSVKVNGTVKTRLQRRSIFRVQRFTDDDVKNRAHQVWQKKGSPQNQSQEDQDKDYAEARRQLEVDERSHGIWEEKGSPQNQTDDQKKQDYTDADFQISTTRDLNSAADGAGLTTKLQALAAKPTAWSVLKYVFKNLKDTIKVLIQGSLPISTACFGLAGAAADKAEMLYYLGGTADWKRTMMAAHGITHDDFRQSLVRLNVFEVGTAGHKGGKEVDQLIASRLSALVQTNIDARGRIAGHMAVVGAEDWDVIGREQYGAVTWDGGKKNTLNAFVDRGSDPPRVFVNKNRGNAGTAIHEACHMWGDAGRPINGASHELNEGVTEYFARKICSALAPPIPRTVYANEFAAANKMVTIIGEPLVAGAFFDGNLAAVVTRFTNVKWTTFYGHMNNQQWAQANALLDTI